MGLICHEFGYTLNEVYELTAEQINFLISWLNWFKEAPQAK